MAEFTDAQARAINNLSANIAVSAGAGAGKTRVLVERYINILRQRRANCDEILAITFTNKAAKEMKERIRAKAAELAETAASAEERRLWRETIDRLEYAPIGTFHSFCARLLRGNPVEAALDPGFAVLDEAAAMLLWEKTLDEVLTAGLAEDEQWLDRLLSAYGKKALLAITPGLYEKFAARGIIGEGMSEDLAGPYRRALADEEKIKEELRQSCRELMEIKGQLNPKTANYRHVEALAANWPAVAAAIEAAGGGDEECYAVLHSYLDGLDRRTKGKEVVAAIKEAINRLERLRADRAALELVPAWCRLLLNFAAALAAKKFDQRVLAFTDLEVLSARLLKSYPAVREKYGNRIKQIMVDEFQDTNELQRQIIYLLAGGDADVLRGEKLFIVGDAKQSIYRFRGADVALFDKVSRDIAASGGETVELDVNFRSMDGLLSLYNECFHVIMGTADDDVAFSPLQAYRAGADATRLRAELLVTVKGELAEGMAAREAEAVAVARRIRAMVGAGERLLDHDTTPRAVRFGDIAILFRAAKDIGSYAAALQRAGVPYYIVGGQGFYNCQEINDVLNLLRVVENKFQETALAGVLRSPLFALADQTLSCLKRQGGNLWQGLEACPAAELADDQLSAAVRAGKILAKLRGLRGLVKTADLISLALLETGYGNFVLTQFMGRQKYANLMKLIALAREFEAGGVFTLGDFLRYVARLVEGEVKEGEAVLESEAGDTVKLMTIHKAKGLEYPVVFLPDLQRKFRDETAPLLVGADGCLGMKAPLGDQLAATSPYAQMAAEEKRLSQLELKRLLYVALTRAKDYIVLSGVGDKGAGEKDFGELSSWLSWLGRVCGLNELTGLPEKIMAGQTEILVRYDLADLAKPQPGEAAIQSCGQAELEPVIRNIAPVATEPSPDAAFVFSASKVDKFRRCQRAFYYEFIAGLPELGVNREPGGKNRPPSQLTGTVLHRCLEVLDDGAAWQQSLNRALSEKAPPAWRDLVAKEAAPLLARYVSGDFYRKNSVLPVRKEWRFNYRLPETDGGPGYYFTGGVDCLIEYDGACGIVDYKTDRITISQADAKAQQHKLQLMLYSLAVEAAWGKPVKEACIYFWRPDMAVPVPVNEAEKSAARDELLAVCRYVAGHEREAEYRCGTQWCKWCGYSFFCPRT